MDERLCEAASLDNATSLLELLRGDELIFDRALGSCVSDTPLHIAAILGHVDFAREILTRKPKFASVLNSQGFSPLHLAAAKGYVEIVNELLKADSSGGICLVRDRDGRTPLHMAAIKGYLSVLQMLLQAKQEAGRVRTHQGETILHLSVKHNHFEMAKWLLEWADDDDEYVNMKDDEGNTALHISASKKQIQIVQLLLAKTGAEVNAINNYGLTASDVLLQLNPSELSVMDGIVEINARVIPTTEDYHTTNCQKNKPGNEKKHSTWLRKRWSTLMVVAILISTVTFEAGINPPGGNCRKEGWRCILFEKNATHGYERIELDYSPFMVIDTVGFLVSLTIILLLISKPPLRPTVLMRVLMLFMWISVSSVAMTFAYFMSAMTPTLYFSALGPILWLGLLYLLQFIRFVLWLLRTRGRGILKKRKASNVDVEKDWV